MLIAALNSITQALAGSFRYPSSFLHKTQLEQHCTQLEISMTKNILITTRLMCKKNSRKRKVLRLYDLWETDKECKITWILQSLL